jgi:hypothetical protein
MILLGYERALHRSKEGRRLGAKGHERPNRDGRATSALHPTVRHDAIRSAASRPFRARLRLVPERQSIRFTTGAPGSAGPLASQWFIVPEFWKHESVLLCFPSVHCCSESKAHS